MKTRFFGIDDQVEDLASAMEKLLQALSPLGARQPGHDHYFDGRVDKREAARFVITFALDELCRLNCGEPLVAPLANPALPAWAITLYEAASELERRGWLDPDLGREV